MEYRFDNYILKAFLASGLLAVVMMALALGLIQLFRYGPGLPASITLILALLSGGIIYAFSENIHPWEELLSGFAICIIIAMTLLSYLKRSLGEIEY